MTTCSETMSKMGIKDVWRRLTRKHQSIEETIRQISFVFSKQISSDGRHQFMSMIEGMVCAGEFALAVHSLRTGYDEYGCNDIEIDKQLKNLEERFGDEIDKLLKQ